MITNSEFRNINFDESSQRPSSSLVLNDVSPIVANREHFSGIDTSCIPPDLDIFQIDPRELFYYMDTLQSTKLVITSIGDLQLNRDLINSLQNDRSIRFVNHNEFDRSIDSTLPTDWNIQPVQRHAQTAAVMQIGDNNQAEYSENRFMLDEFDRSTDLTLSTDRDQSVQSHTQTATMMETGDETEEQPKEPRVYLYLIELINEPSKHGSYGWVEWDNKQAGIIKILKPKLVAEKWSEIKGNTSSNWKNFKRGVRTRIGQEIERVGEGYDYRITFSLRISAQYGWI